MRDKSGGDGEYRGGDGVIREYEFLQQIQVSILSEVGLFFKEVWRTRRSYGTRSVVQDSHMDFTEENPQRLGVTSGSSNCVKRTVTHRERDERRGKTSCRSPRERNRE